MRETEWPNRSAEQNVGSYEEMIRVVPPNKGGSTSTSVVGVPAKSRIEPWALNMADTLVPEHSQIDDPRYSEVLISLCKGASVRKMSDDYLVVPFSSCGLDKNPRFKRKKVSGTRQLTERVTLHRFLDKVRALNPGAAEAFKVFGYSVKGHKCRHLGIKRKVFEQAALRVARRTAGALVLNDTRQVVFSTTHLCPSNIVGTRLAEEGLFRDMRLVFNGTGTYFESMHGCSVNPVQSLSHRAQALVFEGLINADLEKAHLALIDQDLTTHLCPSNIVGTTAQAISHARNLLGNSGPDMLKHHLLCSINGEFKLNLKLNQAFKHRPDLKQPYLDLIEPVLASIRAWHLSLGYRKGQTYTNALGKTRECHKLGHLTSSSLQARVEVVVRAAAAHVRMNGGTVVAHMIDGLVLDCNRQTFEQMSDFVQRTFGLNMREKAL